MWCQPARWSNTLIISQQEGDEGERRRGEKGKRARGTGRLVFLQGRRFHRVSPGVMVAVGGSTGAMEHTHSKRPIKNDAGNGLKNDTGTIGMARTSDPDTATAQFFINVKSNDFLNRDKAQDGV